MSRRSVGAGLAVAALAIAVFFGFARWRVPPATIRQSSVAAGAPMPAAGESTGSSAPSTQARTLPLPESAWPPPTPLAQVRFDPSAWPALPPDDAPVAEVLEGLRARATRGDHGAACWLGVALNECIAWRDSTAPVVAEPDVVTDNANLKQLERLDAGLAQSQRCASVPDATLLEGAAYLRQAAFAGNLVAIERFINMDVLPPTRLPEGAALRQVLADHQALVWVGLASGSWSAFEVLATESRPGTFDMAAPPDRPIVAANDKIALAVLLRELDHLLATVHVPNRDGSFGLRVLAEQELPSGGLPPAFRARMQSRAQELFDAGWVNRTWHVDANGRDIRSKDQQCRDFVDVARIAPIVARGVLR